MFYIYFYSTLDGKLRMFLKFDYYSYNMCLDKIFLFLESLESQFILLVK